MGTGSPPRQITTSRFVLALSLSGSPRTPRCTNDATKRCSAGKLLDIRGAERAILTPVESPLLLTRSSLFDLRSTINVAYGGHSVNEAEQSAPHWWHSWLPVTITTAGDRCCCNLQARAQIVLENANLPIPIEKFCRNPVGSLFHKCGISHREGRRDEIKPPASPGQSQETRRIRTHLLVFERSHKRRLRRRAEFGL